jgi:hypothetical protein
MQLLSIPYLEALLKNNKETSLFGKWITLNDIQPLYNTFKTHFEINQIGSSEAENPIFSVKIGSGKKKILIWSQMHGNEATGTKAVFDLLNCFLNEEDTVFKEIMATCTILIVPMLNPDGAANLTRVNGCDVDLNRDATTQEAKESKLLRGVLETFNPQFSFNLHDQRTIFGVEGTENPATISFLAPSEEKTRKLTTGRKETMNVIIAMNRLLQQMIPNCIGRYTDEFYPTATGDNFQKLGFNTILIESGHYPNDYEREESRKYTFYSILQGIYYISKNKDFKDYEEYFTIPNNVKCFFDVIHRSKNGEKDIAYQYEDSIKNNTFVSSLKKVQEGDLNSYLAHHEIVFENLK